MASNRVIPLQFSSVFWEGLRPWAYTASIIPMLLAMALAWPSGKVSGASAFAVLIGGLSIHSGVNLFNYCYDPRVVRAAQSSCVWEKARCRINALAWAFYALALIVGIHFTLLSGWPVMVVGLTGLIAGYFYSAPPIHYQRRGIAFILVFILMGPLMVYGAYYALTGAGSWSIVWISLPIGSLVSLILISDEMRDVESDAKNGVLTFTVRVGYPLARLVYLGLVVLAYTSTALLMITGTVPWVGAIVLFSLPTLRRALSWIDAETPRRPALTTATATLHFVFGILFTTAILFG